MNQGKITTNFIKNAKRLVGVYIRSFISDIRHLFLIKRGKRTN